VPSRSTGGVSALKDAFEALGWDVPHYVEGGGVTIRAAQAGLHVERPHPRDIGIFAANTTATGGSNDARPLTHRWDAKFAPFYYAYRQGISGSDEPRAPTRVPACP
jgi:hypothetical protein